MQYTVLGHSGIRIPRLCLGGMSFGERVRAARNAKKLSQKELAEIS